MAHQVARLRVALRGQLLAERRAKHQRSRVGQDDVQAWDRPEPAEEAPDGATTPERRGPVEPVGHQDQSRRRQRAARAGDSRAQRQFGAEVVASDHHPRAAGLEAEPGQHLGEPLGGVRVARPILGVAVERQIR